jgi:hypothetical protein
MSDTATEDLAPAAREAVEKLAYSVNETIAAIGIKRTALYALIDSGQLRTVKANGRRLVPRSAILDFLGGGNDDRAA